MRQILFILSLYGLTALAACSSGGNQTQPGASKTTNAGANVSGNSNSLADAETRDGAGRATGGAGEPGGDREGMPSGPLVGASASGVEIRAGGSASADVRLDIVEGFHVNANPPSNKFLIGTQLDVEPAEGITPGKPLYPAALKKKFSFAPEPLAVYEGAATIKLPLRADASAAKGARTLKARIRVQPCNDEACYPPRTIETSIPLTIN